MQKENCYMCQEAYQDKLIELKEVEVASQECFICRKPVCEYHSSPDINNKNIIICDNCQAN